MNNQSTTIAKRLILGILAAQFSVWLGCWPVSSQEVLKAPSPMAEPARGKAKISLPHSAAQLNFQHSLTIVAFGSSTTEGTGATSPARSYPRMLETDIIQALGSEYSVKVINRGVAGEDILDMMKRIDTDVLSQKPGLVIWQIGTNDPIRGVPLSTFETTTRAGIAAIRGIGSDVMLLEPGDTHGTFMYRFIVRQISLEMRVPIIKRYDLFYKWLNSGKTRIDLLMCPDNIHFTDEGYARLAAEISTEILNATGFKSNRDGSVSLPPWTTSVVVRLQSAH
jgi:lysophospholipase L1-like esterase